VLVPIVILIGDDTPTIGIVTRREGILVTGITDGAPLANPPMIEEGVLGLMTITSRKLDLNTITSRSFPN
jgi:hypothetical protein